MVGNKGSSREDPPLAATLVESPAPPTGGTQNGKPWRLARRDFLRVTVGPTLALPFAPFLPPQGADAQKSPPPSVPPLGPAERDLVVRMQRDLERALLKPVDQRKWVMAIDLRKCTGCNACVNACRSENALPPGVTYRVVLDEEIGTYPNVSRRFVPRTCMQCDNPPCVPVCPVGATFKRPDGVVAIDYERCIGCRYCITACPYGARSFDFGEYFTANTPAKQPYETERPSFEYGKTWPRKDARTPVGNARKCTFCLHRVEQGVLPACVSTCIGRASYFGDANDPQSLVSELITRPNARRMKEEAGTRPNVYYLE